MKGSYLLIMELTRDKNIAVGALGIIHFKKGYYAYVGSAMNSIEKRVERHLRKEKKLRWHIDYLLKEAKVEKIYYKESQEKEECRIAKIFLSNGFSYVKNFGASDCNCESHLFYAEDEEKLQDTAKKAQMELYCKI
ncbi:MAG: GIY-YIG nuclease family protein [Thermoplasmata archaeon]|nr:MAG: GIY-YIG nuclease family protein [Thermoplasmata archaeon]